eukprot:TRINITY_DN1731_c0_g1_i1.p1 TRINITY_DN1731_c0_g1~~TRINITY_DN1731_c0_g1_i1.p1  ORF type:complete len:461 (+),score=93.60 TRINITY_DN1731_c0_g1_i1:76-1458(+)
MSESTPTPTSSHRRVLVLGAGMVVQPLVRYLGAHGFHQTIASRTEAKAVRICQGVANAVAMRFDIETEADQPLLDELTRAHDIVLSLLPYIHHVAAATVALRHNKHFCTTSYVSPAMRALHPQAQQNGLFFLNECGVDPGLDHMSAQKVIDEVHALGGQVVSFKSYCGGLPAPDANDNPFGYKLSWSPRGVLLASRNDAKFYRDGQLVHIKGEDLFDSFEAFSVPGYDGPLDGYPNRDSTSYSDFYRIPESKTCVRGTFRNPGWCRTLKKMADLGLLSLEPQDFTAGVNYAALIRTIVGAAADLSVADAVASKLGLQVTDHVIASLQWLGLFEETPIPPATKTILDAVCYLFEQKMVYKEGERDMLVMHHEFIVEYPESGRKERRTTTMVDYGQQNQGGDSSMSRTVTLPLAIAIRLFFDGKLHESVRGVLIPNIPELYEPILKEVEELGIHFVDRVEEL